MARRILITGGCGFVAGHLVAAVLPAMSGDDRLLVTGLRRPPAFPQDPALQWRDLDVLDRPAVDAVLADFAPTTIVHLAAAASVHAAQARPAEAWRINGMGAFTMAEAVAARAPASTVLMASSGEVYGGAFRSGLALDETVPPEPMTVYARSKLAAEMIFADVLPATARLVVARPFNHTGPGQDERFVVPDFCARVARIERGEAPPHLVVGNLEAERDFLDVGDVAAAYRGLIFAEDLPGRVVVNIASGVARPIAAIVDILRREARADFTLAVDPDRLRPGETARALGDSGRLRALTGWAPQVPFYDTVRGVLGHWRRRVGGHAQAMP